MFPTLLHTAGNETHRTGAVLSFSHADRLPTTAPLPPVGAASGGTARMAAFYDLLAPEELPGGASLGNLESAWAPTQRMGL